MKKQKQNKQRKSATAVLVLCLVAVLGMVGNAVFRQGNNKEEDRLAKQEEQEKKQEETQQAAAAESDRIETEGIEEEKEQEPVVTETKSPVQSLTFSEEEPLLWPVDGNVLLNYSMDQTVYFPTLDQYKYNPALIVSGEVGEEVFAAAPGMVTAIEEDAQTGTTVIVDLGSGYVAKYGQLEDVTIQEGSYVEKGEILGYLSEPTKYYSVEGCNLYFQLLKDQEPVNPMEYLDV